MKVLVRTDASASIGSGHVARCLTLAHALRREGVDVTFACRTLEGHLLERIVSQRFAVVGLPALYVGEQRAGLIEAEVPWQADLTALADALPHATRFDWLIVDHYGLDARWERGARRFATRLMAIDDLANRPHATDVLLDQNYSAQAVDGLYRQWLEEGCRTLLGPRYALLREVFEREPVPLRDEVHRVLVNFGGYDAARQCHATMLALAAFPELSIDFVAGMHNPDWQAMQALVQQRPNWRLHALAEDFFGLMRDADLFIGAGGGTTWERAVLGIPSLCVSVANNQALNARLLAEAGGHLYLGPHEQVRGEQLRQAVALLRGNLWLRRSLARRAAELVDGRGARRVAALLIGDALRVRIATFDDARLLFDGRNAEPVRRGSFDTAPMAWEGHVDWLGRTLTDPMRLLLVGETASGPLGVLRYDRHDDRAEVSIYLFEGRDGCGWGRALLEAGEARVRGHWPDVRCLDASVMPSNQASLALFRSAGYTQATNRFQRVMSDE